MANASQGGGRDPCSAQTHTWGLDHSQERWKAKVRNAQGRAPVRHSMWQDQTLPWLFHPAIPTSSWQLQVQVLSLGGWWFAGWRDPLPSQRCAGGGCQGRVIPHTGPSLGISGLFSTRFRALELLAPSGTERAVPQPRRLAAAPGLQQRSQPVPPFSPCSLPSDADKSPRRARAARAG